MAKKIKVTVKPVVDERYESYGDEGIVTRDRDLTESEIQEIKDKARGISNEQQAKESPIQPDEPTVKPPTKKGLLKLKCACGRIANITDEIIEDGLSWSMIIGNNHFLTLHCDECNNELTMFIEEIVDDELPEESKQE
jgi:hypothetical protein